MNWKQHILYINLVFSDCLLPVSVQLFLCLEDRAQPDTYGVISQAGTLNHPAHENLQTLLGRKKKAFVDTLNSQFGGRSACESFTNRHDKGSVPFLSP